ncbi:MAG: DUF4405 domain-containing protein [Anaerolineae bacterium]
MRKLSPTKLNLLVDIVILMVFLVDYDPAITGLTLHEWIGIPLALIGMLHLLLHWKWVVETTRRVWGRLVFQARLNYILNIILLMAMVLVIGSGFMISRQVLPFFGLSGVRSGFWVWLHFTSAEVVIWIVALHIALHWQWIVSALKRYIVQPTRPGSLAVRSQSHS